VLKNKDSKYIVGSTMTIADIDNVFVANNFFYNEASKYHKELSEVLTKYPTLESYYKGLGEEFGEYLKNRPQPRPF
jgi:glutathione S-transferase